MGWYKFEGGSLGDGLLNKIVSGDSAVRIVLYIPLIPVSI